MIEDRLYSVPEVAKLIGHSQEYVRALIDSAKLDGIRPAGPGRSKGQWRVKPDSIRRWMGIAPTRSPRGLQRQIEAGRVEFWARRGKPVPLPSQKP